MSSSIQLDANTKAVPKGWTLIVKQDPVEQKSKGGIVLTDVTVEKSEWLQDKGTVMAIGEFCWNDEPGPRCGVGDRVLYRHMAGQLLKQADGEETYRLINDKDVYAVLEAI